MQRGCAQCRQLWERYFSAAVEEFSVQERLQIATRVADVEASAALRAAAESAVTKVMAIRLELAAHRQWHAEQVTGGGAL
jgi:hypothetical protein